MKIQENRATPAPPPVESYTLTVSPEELRLLRYFVANTVIYHEAGAVAGERFLRLTDNLVDMSTVNFAPQNCFLETK